MEGPRRSPGRRLKHWGWGFEDQQPSERELGEAAAGIRSMFGFGGEPERAVPLEEVDLRAPRLKSDSPVFSDDRHDRAVHSMGKAYRDIVRGFRGVYDNPPDLVAHPADEAGVLEVLERAAEWDAAVIPFGGGTSVCGGVEARLPDPDRPVVSLDLTGLAEIHEVDHTSLAIRAGSGLLGPDLEAKLREQDLTLRHYPQSFEYSTLGGWIATRAGGHFATGETHIDDLVESVRALTPTGEWQSRRLPGSGAGPSPDRLMIGSEGALGVITEAWMRVRPRPKYKATATIGFDEFSAAATGAVRAIAQARLGASNCRLIDPLEAKTTMAGDGTKALLLLGFESADCPVGTLLDQGVRIAEQHGGKVLSSRVSEPDFEAGDKKGTGGGSQWKDSFLLAPYLRDTFVACGVLSETFETAITWDRFEEFHADVMSTARRVVAEVCGVSPDGEGAPRISCRLTHVYPDGAAPYFTVLAPARRGSEVEQWDEIKAAVSEALIEGGGTITHHHAVGRDHRPWYDLQRPDAFARSLGAVKAELDPAGLLNPGVLVGP